MRSTRFVRPLIVFASVLMICFVTAESAAAQETTKGTGAEGMQVSGEQDTSYSTPVDVMMVLDNSGSMKKNDPQHLLPDVVSSFARQLKRNSRLGIILFDETVDLALGLRAASDPGFIGAVAGSVKRIDYSGQRTDIPAGFERAMYELRQSGRKDAQKIIVLLTDGLVDVGDPAQDLERAKWLREDLAREADRLGIRVFGIALTDAADFQLLQSVSQATGSDYFRVLTADDIGVTFNQIRARIEELAGIPHTAAADEEPVKGRATPTEATEPETGFDGIIWVALAAGLVVIGVIVLFARSRRSPARVAKTMPTVILSDPSGHTNASEHTFKKSPIRIGRDERMNDIVIPQTTVSGQQAIITYRDGAFYLRDLRSTNGTFVNDKKISDPDTAREVLLKHQDRIRFDVYDFQFEIAGMESAKQTQLSGEAPVGGTVLRAEPPPSPVKPKKKPASPKAQPAKAEAKAREDEDAETKVKPGKCANHPEWNASEVCLQCGQAFCKNCITEQAKGKVICKDCAKKAA